MKKIENYDLITPEKICSQEIRIIIVDDQIFVRNFLHNIISADPNFQIVGTASNGKEAIDRVESLEPDVILIDLEMPEMDGITATEILALEYPQCKVLVLSSHEDSEHLQTALHAGAKGYILKTSSPQEITNALYAVARGHSQLSPGLLEKVLAPQVENNPNFKGKKNKRFNSQVRKKQVANQAQNSAFRTIFYFLLATTALIIPVTIFTKVDRTITVSGKLETQGQTITVNAPITGEVVALEVAEGATITKGQTLIKLASPATNTQLQQQQKQLVQQQNELANLNLVKNQQQLELRNKQQESKTQELEKQSLIESLKQKLDNLKANYSQQIAEQYTTLEQAKKAISEAKATHQIAQIRQETAREKAKRYQQAYQKGAIGQTILSEANQILEERELNLDRTLAEVNSLTKIYQEKQDSYNQKQQQISTAIKQAALRVQEQQKSYQSLVQTNDADIFDTQEVLNNTEYKIVTLQEAIVKNQSEIANLKLQLEQNTLFAPINGKILQLLTKNVGETVKSEQAIATIIPQESSFILRARVSIPEDKSDLLKVGLPVKLKFDAYPFHNYGVISGRLVKVSTDAVAINNNYQETTNNKRNLEENRFTARRNNHTIQIELDRKYLKSENQQILLTPGQAATAEIIVGKHRLINVFFEPFMD